MFYFVDTPIVLITFIHSFVHSYTCFALISICLQSKHQTIDSIRHQHGICKYLLKIQECQYMHMHTHKTLECHHIKYVLFFLYIFIPTLNITIFVSAFYILILCSVRIPTTILLSSIPLLTISHTCHYLTLNVSNYCTILILLIYSSLFLILN